MIKYKLLNQDLTTHNNFQWEVGKTYTITKPGNKLCSDEVFHFYDSPECAAMFNIRHARINNAVCYAVEIDQVVAFDGLKGGAKTMTLIDKVSLPPFSKRQKVIFANLCAQSVSKYLKDPIKKWDIWANDYLNNKTTNCTAADAADAAASAADAAAYADAAASAAAYAAHAAAYAAHASADAAHAAHAAASAAAYAADTADAEYPDFKALAKQALSYD